MRFTARGSCAARVRPGPGEKGRLQFPTPRAAGGLRAVPPAAPAALLRLCHRCPLLPAGTLFLPATPSACRGPRAVRPRAPGPGSETRPRGPPEAVAVGAATHRVQAQRLARSSAIPPPLRGDSQPLPSPILIPLGREKKKNPTRPHLLGKFRP